MKFGGKYLKLREKRKKISCCHTNIANCNLSLSLETCALLTSNKNWISAVAKQDRALIIH